MTPSSKPRSFRLPASALPLLVLFAGSCARRNGGTPESPALLPPLPGFRDVLGEWSERCRVPPPGASDAALDFGDPEKKAKGIDAWTTALAKGRSMLRFAKQARTDLAADPVLALAGLQALLDSPDLSPQEAREALELARGILPAPTLGGFALRLCEDPRAWLRAAAYDTLAVQRHAIALPRLLRRMKYETEPEATVRLFLAVGALGDPAPIDNLLAWLPDPKWRSRAGPPLAELVTRFGESYDPNKDGWPGLESKARKILDEFRRTGLLARDMREVFAVRREAVLREFLLFLRELGGTKLRPIDDARYVARRAGVFPLPLYEEGLSEKRRRIRVRILQILTELGPPAAPSGPGIAALWGDPLCRAYAIEALGAVRSEAALPKLLAVLRAEDPRPFGGALPLREARIASLKGLRLLRDSRAIPPLLALWRGNADLELRVFAAAALMECAAGLSTEARSFLSSHLEKGDYHPPTLRELLGR